MNRRLEKVLAPLLILIFVLVVWESAVTVFEIEQFLLPKPSVILSNLVRVVVLTPADGLETPAQVEANLRVNRLLVSIPAETPPELVAKYVPGVIVTLPAGSRTVLITQGQNLNPIFRASLFTVRGALGGFIIGTGLGILVALITARWTTTREALLPFAIAVNSMPIIACAPILNNWFGIDNPTSKMGIVVLLTFFPMMINTVRGLTLVDNRSLELMRSYAASEFAILRKLRLPNSLPYMFNGFKIAAALSMIGAVVAEYFGGPRIALGVFITQEASLFRFASAWAAIIAACILGIALYLLIIFIERLVMPWHHSFR